MFFGKKEDIQRLNLEVPKPGIAPAAKAATQSLPDVDPAKLEAVNRKAKEILDSGRISELLFVCGVANGLLMLQSPDGQGPAMLLFSSPFSASDYLRATGAQGKVGQLKVEMLGPLAQSWLSMGVQRAVLDRCPRCPQFLSIPVASMPKWTKEDFAKIWAHHRATRFVLGETRARSAMSHSAAGAHAAARTDLEYIRDHFDCGIPYLHQLIGLLAGMQGDEPAKAASLERLKEFGPQFAGPLEFSPELFATATAGLMTNYGMTPQSAGSK